MQCLCTSLQSTFSFSKYGFKVLKNTVILIVATEVPTASGTNIKSGKIVENPMCGEKLMKVEETIYEA